MNKVLRHLCSFSLSLSLVVSGIIITKVPETVSGASYCTDYSGINIEAQNYDRWSSTVKSYITAVSTSSYMVVFGGDNTNSAFVEYYSSSSHALTNSKSIPLELPIFGGFYASSNYYFLVTGQTNTSQSSNTEVYRITKYDKNWNRIGSVGLSNCNTTVPFDAGSCRMTDNGTYLLIRTCHEMYNGHQANVTIQVHMNNMKITDSYTDVMNTGYGYVSHSFNQFIQLENNNIISVDHGDAYPRSIVLLKYKTDVSKGTFKPGYYTQCTDINALAIQGASGANDTGATVGGFEISDSNYLVAGNSIIQDSSYSSRKTRNVYVSAINKSTNNVNLRWITTYPEGTVSTSTPQLVKISGSRFMLLWSHNNKIYYAILKGDGSLYSRIFSYPGNISDCKPIYSNQKITWITRFGEITTFYDIPVNNPQRISKTTVSNGHDLSGITVSGTTSTLRCPKCGRTITVKNVDTNFSVWWRNLRTDSSYFSSPTSNFIVGDTMEVWVNYSNDSSKNQEYIVDIADPNILSFSGINGNFFRFTAKKEGSCKVKVSSKWNPSKYVSKTVTVKANPNSSSSSSSIYINGFQYNPSIYGTRAVYTVADKINNQPVIETGLIYGLSTVVSQNDMTVFSSGRIYSYQATEVGKLATSLGASGTHSYVMTMTQDISNLAHSAITAQYYIRPYAELADGTYLYGNTVSYSLYNLADKLYKSQLMSNSTNHNFLYNHILTVITPGYKKITYNGSYGIVGP